MKKIIFALSTLALLSCSKESVAPLNEENISFEETTQTDVTNRRIEPNRNVAHYDLDFDVVLKAGQHYDIGYVNMVYNSVDDVMTVTFVVEDTEWSMTETHLYIGECGEQPMNGQGNPQVGRFPYKDVHDETEAHEYEYTIEDVSQLTVNPEGCIAAHAVVVNSDGTVSHTAWGEGDAYATGSEEENGNNWAMIFGYNF